MGAFKMVQRCPPWISALPQADRRSRYGPPEHPKTPEGERTQIAHFIPEMGDFTRDDHRRAVPRLKPLVGVTPTLITTCRPVA